MSRGLTFGGVVAIGLSLIGSPAHADDLEPIAGKPTHDVNGVVHVAVGVKNNGTKTFRLVHVECGIYHELPPGAAEGDITGRTFASIAAECKET